jgi:hypothetical protein
LVVAVDVRVVLKAPEVTKEPPLAMVRVVEDEAGLVMVRLLALIPWNPAPMIALPLIKPLPVTHVPQPILPTLRVIGVAKPVMITGET